MKSLLPAVPVLLDAGWKVRVWCFEADEIDPRITVERMVSPVPIWFFESIWFWFRAHVRYWWRFRGKSGIAKRRQCLVQATGFYLIKADLLLIQFVFELYRRMVRRFPEQLHLSPKERVALAVAVVLEKVSFLPSASPRLWMVVSRKLSEDLRELLPAGDRNIVVANSFNPTRFNLKVRSDWRKPSRAEMGLGEEETVFAFVCLGAFERKGLPLALKACWLLNQQGIKCRLLVIGGPSSAPPDLSPWFRSLGISDGSFVVCRGRTPVVEKFLAAADALLFPSYFEAFANVAIEAAALGLRLYLTPHYGSEMLMGEGCQGKLVPWDAAGIAAVLAEEMASGAIRQENHSLGLVPSPGQLAAGYAEALEIAWTLRGLPC